MNPEDVLSSALREEADRPVAPPNPGALEHRLARHDRFVVVRNVGVAATAAVVVLAGVLVIGGQRRDRDVQTADSTVLTTAPPATGASTTQLAAGDGTTTTTAVADPTGATTTTSPGTEPTSTTLPPGVTVTTADPAVPTVPGGPTTTATVPGGPTTTRAPTTTATTAPTTTTTTDPGLPPPGDPSTWCAAQLVDANIALAPTAPPGASVKAYFVNGWAPPTGTAPGSLVSAWADTDPANSYILSRSTRADPTTGKWTWALEFSSTSTPLNTPITFNIGCVNGHKLTFTVTRTR